MLANNIDLFKHIHVGEHIYIYINTSEQIMGTSQVYKFEIFLWIRLKICTNAHALSLVSDNSSVENS